MCLLKKSCHSYQSHLLSVLSLSGHWSSPEPGHTARGDRRSRPLWQPWWSSWSAAPRAECGSSRHPEPPKEKLLGLGDPESRCIHFHFQVKNKESLISWFNGNLSYPFVEIHRQGRFLGRRQTPVDEVAKAPGIQVERPLLLWPVSDTESLVTRLFIPRPVIKSNSINNSFCSVSVFHLIERVFWMAHSLSSSLPLDRRWVRML